MCNGKAEVIAWHQAGFLHHGVNLQGQACNMLDEGVVEPLHMRLSKLKHATEIVLTMVKIDGDAVPMANSV
jgi:chaperonin GroEL (HSP60 family)